MVYMPIGRLADLEMGPKVLAQGAEIPTANRVRLVIFIGYSAFYWVYMKASDIAVPSGFFVTVNGKLRPLTLAHVWSQQLPPNSEADPMNMPAWLACRFPVRGAGSCVSLRSFGLFSLPLAKNPMNGLSSTH